MNNILHSEKLPSGQDLELVQGDITLEQVDAIVNAANRQLLHSGSLAGVISRKAGPDVQKESTEWVSKHGPVTHHEPAYTSAGSLPCRYVIHAVGPVWGSGDEDAKLGAAINGSLQLAEKLKLTSIAVPAISTGIFRFPKPRAANIIISAIHTYFKQSRSSKLQQVRLTLFDQPTIDTFEEAWESIHSKDGATK